MGRLELGLTLEVLGQCLHQGRPQKERDIKPKRFFYLVNFCFVCFLFFCFAFAHRLVFTIVCSLPCVFALCCYYLWWCVVPHLVLLLLDVVHHLALLLFVVVCHLVLLLLVVVYHFALLLLVVVMLPCIVVAYCCSSLLPFAIVVRCDVSPLPCIVALSLHTISRYS